MTASVAVTSPINPYSILDDINAESIHAVENPEHYAAIHAGVLPPSNWAQKLITGLQIESFIPAKIAILIKNNWHDTDYVSSLLAGIIVDLRDTRQIISSDLAKILLSKQGQSTATLELLYACMLCHEKEDVYTLDDLGTLSRFKLLEVISNKEQVNSKLYLEGRLRKLAERFPEEKHALDALLQDLRHDEPEAFRAKFLAFLDKVIQSQPEGIKKYCFEDLKKSLTGIPPSSGFMSFFQRMIGETAPSLFVSLYRAMKTQDYYASYLAKVSDLTGGLRALEPAQLPPLVEKCKKAYQNTLYLLADFQNMPCASRTLFSLHHGLIRGEWMKINALFQHKIHQFCHCHAVKEPKQDEEAIHRLWPLDQVPFTPVKPSHPPHDLAENIVIFGNNWGSGHKMATQNIAEIVEENGYHPLTIDLADDVLLKDDLVRTYLGWVNPVLRVSSVFNFFLQHRAFSILNFLKGTSTPKPADPSPDSVKRIVQRMLEINPSMIINTNSLQNEPVIKAASLLGVPTMVINTDVDRTILSRNRPPDYPHFKMGIPFPERFMTPKVTQTESPEQIAVVGPPTKQIYDQRRSPVEIEALRQQLERQVPGMTIPKDKKLIVISNGSNGAISPYPELIAKKYAGKNAKDIPFVVVVLCGKNNRPYLYEVTNKIATRLPAKTMQAFEHLDSGIMEHLYRVASYGGGVIGKAGGLTVFETIKCGTRLIIDHMTPRIVFRNPIRALIGFINWFLGLFGYENQFPWENVNQEFMVSLGLGTVVKNEEQFYRAFDRMLQQTEPVQLIDSISGVLNFSERLPVEIENMKRKVQEDVSLRDRRVSQIDPHQIDSFLM